MPGKHEVRRTGGQDGGTQSTAGTRVREGEQEGRAATAGGSAGCGRVAAPGLGLDSHCWGPTPQAPSPRPMQPTHSVPGSQGQRHANVYTPGAALGGSSQGLKSDRSMQPFVCVLPAHSAHSTLGRSCDLLSHHQADHRLWPPGLGAANTTQLPTIKGATCLCSRAPLGPRHLILRWIPGPEPRLSLEPCLYLAPSPGAKVFS